MLSSIPGIENLSPAVRWLIAAVIIFVLLALFALVLRRLTGRPVTLTSERGRARQPRLGIVDVYDLDRQRQLILLRRDNVEHLLLVGGPNDVVVETNIVRVPGARAGSGAAGEAADRPAEAQDKPQDVAPSRPVIEGLPSRGGRGVELPSPAGRTDAGATIAPGLSTRIQTTAPRSVEPAQPRFTPSSPSTVRPPARTGRVQPALVAGPPAGPRAAPPAAGEGTAVALAAPSAETKARVGLSDMARQLGAALSRSAEPAPAAKPEPPPPAPATRPARNAHPDGGERGRAPDVPKAPPADEPPSAPTLEAAPPERRPEESAADRDIEQAAIPPDAVAKPPAPTPPAQPASPPPEAVQPAPPPPPRPEPPKAPEPAPEAPRADPFSIEDIEAEFARLLGRPLDRKDRQ